MNSAAAYSPVSVPLSRHIAIQGIAGSFHEIAARFYFDQAPIVISASKTFDEIVSKVTNQTQAGRGLMAIENSLAGTLMNNYSLLLHSKLNIVGEVYLRIKQNLAVLPGQRLENLKEVHSHPMAIAQCRDFFAQYPHIQLVENTDTATSARRIQEGQLAEVGAICSTLAADMYDLEIIRPSIETNKKNYTRFLVLEHQRKAKMQQKANKVSLSFTLAHEIGNLHKVLAIFSAYQLNMTKIQSTPIPGQTWEYNFFVDFEVGGTLGWDAAVDAISPLVDSLRIMGVYNKGDHFEY